MRFARALPILALLGGAAMGSAATASPSGYHVEYAFTGGANGTGPQSALLGHGDKLWGTVEAGGNGFGAVFTIDPATGAETTAYAFKGGDDGGSPVSPLIEDGGALYGVTFTGGTSGMGTVYSLDPASGTERVVYAFKGGADGAYPNSLVKIGKLLYGTTLEGGGHVSANCAVGGACGTVFTLNPVTGAKTVVYAFTGGADGANPYSALVDLDGKLYGSGNFGGVSAACPDLASCGMIYSFDPATGAEAVVYAFAGGGDGAGPSGLNKIAGHLWGTTEEGGGRCAEDAHGCGEVFILIPASGTKAIVHYFTGAADGWDPAGLTKVGEGFYGVTVRGGHGHGVVYSLDVLTGDTTVLHAFHGPADARVPNEGLTSFGGRLWGTSEEGGDTAACGVPGCGTVFSLRP